MFVCLFVCLFFMRLVSVRASAAKLCMAYLYIQGKVKTGSSRPGRVQERPETRFLENRRKFSSHFCSFQCTVWWKNIQMQVSMTDSDGVWVIQVSDPCIHVMYMFRGECLSFFLYISTPSKRVQGKFLGSILSSRRGSATNVSPKRYLLCVKGPPV